MSLLSGWRIYTREFFFAHIFIVWKRRHNTFLFFTFIIIWKRGHNAFVFFIFVWRSHRAWTCILCVCIRLNAVRLHPLLPFWARHHPAKWKQRPHVPLHQQKQGVLKLLRGSPSKNLERALRNGVTEPTGQKVC